MYIYVCLFMYVYVCMCMYACICMYVYVCMYMYVCICMCVCMYVYVCVCIHVYYVCILYWGNCPGEMVYPKQERELSGGELAGGIVQGRNCSTLGYKY